MGYPITGSQNPGPTQPNQTKVSPIVVKCLKIAFAPISFYQESPEIVSSTNVQYSGVNGKNTAQSSPHLHSHIMAARQHKSEMFYI